MDRMLRLAAPVALMYLGLMLMGFVDLLVVGKLGAAPMGAVGVASAIFSWVMVTGLGMIMGLDYPIAHAVGEGNLERGYRNFVQGIYLAVFLAIPLTAFLLGASQTLDLFGFNAEVLPLAKHYLFLTAPSLIFIFGFNVARSYLQARSIAMPALVALVIGNFLNLILNIGLVFGKWGMPEMGLTGAAIATDVSRAYICAHLVVVVIREDRRVFDFMRKVGFTFDRVLLHPILRLGFPSAVQMAFEVGVFALSTALAAKFSAEQLAAHQIVLQTASMSFMVPMGISSATTVLVGQAMGARDYALARTRGWQGLQIGVGFMFFSAITFLSFPNAILGIYTSENQVIETAKSLLLIAALFQLADGAQVVATGALRGIGDTKISAVTNLIGHWFIGLPLGMWLAFSRDWGVRGIWVGLSSGLVFVGIVLLAAWKKKSAELESHPLPKADIPTTYSH